MKYVIMAGGILILAVICCVVVVILRRRRARYLVSIRDDKTKWEELSAAISPFGYAYDINGDYFHTLPDAWQRQMGYSEIYDKNAIRMNMYFDCEPIYFTHKGRSYLLELWKGQYGITTGAEIGFYVSEKEDAAHPEKLFYESVSDREMIPMRFVLKKQDEVLLACEQVHWWLTGFVLGTFSWPEELRMEVSIAFPDYSMKNSFYNALRKKGYNQIYTAGSLIRFVFETPFAKQPRHSRLRIRLVQWLNKGNCKQYHKLTGAYERTLDKVDYLGMCFPKIYRLLGRMSHLPNVRKYRKGADKYEHSK